MNELPGFRFMDVARFRDPEARVVRIPAGTRGKRELLELLARELHFPHYFGFNWDALDECLRDLSWLAQRRIVLVHEAMPLRDEDQRRTYIQVLCDAVTSWSSGDDHELLAVFNDSCRKLIAEISASSRQDGARPA